MSISWPIRIIATSLTIFLLSVILVPAVALTPLLFYRGLALLLALVLGVLYKPTKWARFPALAKGFDALVVVLSAASLGYVAFNSHAIIRRIGMGHPHDVLASLIGCLVVLEVGRRWLPRAMLFICVIFAAYALYGRLIPIPLLRHPSVSLDHFLTSTMLGTADGILGAGLGVMVELVFIFLLFSAIFQLTGAGEFIMDFANALVGRFRGGPALVAVVSSAMFGTLSGSAVANVASTGVITIPLMKRTGYRPQFAAAVEAVASTGGMIMPPVMGSVAFFISEVTGTPYLTIIKYALIPALIYFSSVGFAVWLEARRTGLVGLPPSELPSTRKVLKKGWHCMLPVVLLVVLLMIDFLPQRAAWYATLLALAQGVIMKRINLKKFASSLVDAARTALPVILAVACAGVIVSSIALTGLGPKLAIVIGALVGEAWLLGMVMVAVFCIVAGTALPTLPTFIVTYVAIAQILPMLGAIGVPILAVHMFMFYYAAMAPLTPPVAITPFTAAGIAGADPFKVGWQAFFLALCGFAIPFLFVQYPQLLLMGQLWPDLLWALVKVGLLILCGSMIVIGWLGKNLHIWQRAVCMIAIVVMVVPTAWGFEASILLASLVVLSALLPLYTRRNKRVLAD